jgi:anti-sigma regulatory factor (Ser/Thr protein kinase)
VDNVNNKFSVPAFHVNIETLCEKVGEAAEQAGFDERTSYACQLAVGEACENVINHGYDREGDGDLILSYTISPGKLILELCDSAPPFNPSVYPAEADWVEEDPPVGGLGLKIIHRVMDKVIYRRKKGRNYLELHKNES